MKITRQIVNDAIKYVPLFAFKNAVPKLDAKIRRKFIEYLKDNNPNKLVNLIEYWKINRYRSFFLFKLSMNNDTPANEIHKKFNGLIKGSDENELIYEVIKNTINQEINDIYIFLKIRSVKKHFKSERPIIPYTPIELDHRKPSYINVIYHVDDCVLECRTPSLDKAREVANLFINFIFKDENASYEQIIIDNEQLINADNNTKCTELNINGEYFGAHQIILKGPDTLRCLNELENKGTGFRNAGDIEIVECKNQAENLLIRTNIGNGIIQILKIVEETSDPYRYLKEKVGI